MRNLRFFLVTVASIGVFFASQALAQQIRPDLGSPQAITPGEQPNQSQQPDYSTPGGGGETQPYHGEAPYSAPEMHPYYGETPSPPDQGGHQQQLPTPNNPNGEFRSPTAPFTVPMNVPGPGTA